MNYARAEHTASLLINGKVLVSGRSANDTILSSAETYDTSTETWTMSGSLNDSRYGHTASALSDGTVLVTGGYRGRSVELYHPITETWTTGGSMSNSQDLHTPSLLANGRVLVTGGSDGSAAFASAELYGLLLETCTTVS